MASSVSRSGAASVDARAAASGQRLRDDRKARGGGRHRDQARQSQFPGNRDHRVSKNGGTLEKAAQMANHASTRTTQLYDRRREELSLDEVERIRV
jgi:hypothetical protein